MKRVYFSRVFGAVAVIFWMAVIFMFSAQTGEKSGDTSGGIVDTVIKFLYPNFNSLSSALQYEITEMWQTIIRKTAHFAEYAILGFLTANAIRTYNLNRFTAFLLPCIISFLYAITDEIHQYFVPDRACRFLDVCIDAAGALTGVIILFLCFWTVKKSKQNQKITNKNN